MMADRSLFMRAAYWAVWLFVFSLPSEKSMELPGIGTLSRLAGALAMAVMVLAVGTEWRVRQPRPAHVALAAYVLWSGCSYFWTGSIEPTAEKLNSYVQLLIFVWLIWEACPTAANVRGLLGAYVAGTAVPFGDTIQRFLSGKQTFYQRYATTGFDPNDLALTMALSIPASYYLSLTTGPVWRWLFRLQIVIAAGTIFLTASRGGTVALTIALSLVLTTAKLLDRRERIGLVAAMAALVPVAIFLVPASSWQRIATLGSEVTTGTLNSRTVLWQGGWEAFRNVPVQGVGLGAYPEYLVGVIGRPWGFTPVAHNTFLSVLVETGLIGFAFFALVFVFLIRGALRLGWLEKRLWFTTLAVWSIGVMSLTWEHRKPTWMLFGLLSAHAGAIGSLASRSINERRVRGDFDRNSADETSRETWQAGNGHQSVPGLAAEPAGLAGGEWNVYK